jgi:hypothetical protein
VIWCFSSSSRYRATCSAVVPGDDVRAPALATHRRRTAQVHPPDVPAANLQRPAHPIRRSGRNYVPKYQLANYRSGAVPIVACAIDAILLVPGSKWHRNQCSLLLTQCRCLPARYRLGRIPADPFLQAIGRGVNRYTYNQPPSLIASIKYTYHPSTCCLCTLCMIHA